MKVFETVIVDLGESQPMLAVVTLVLIALSQASYLGSKINSRNKRIHLFSFIFWGVSEMVFLGHNLCKIRRTAERGYLHFQNMLLAVLLHLAEKELET
jgi:hypothetical protein